MGYVIVFGPCIGCSKTFGFNPHLVPSSSAVTGRREPLCLECVERLNPIRVRNGFEPIVPHPDAYEASEENGLALE